MRIKFTPQKGTPDQKHFEDGDGMAVVIFKTNTIPSPMEFYPVGGVLSDGTVKAVTSKVSNYFKDLPNRTAVAKGFNNGMFAAGVFTDEEASKIFEKSNFKF